MSEIEFTKENPLRVFESFAGYGSQSMALQRLKDNFPDFDFKCVGWSEIDKNAIIVHDVVFPEDKRQTLQQRILNADLSQIDWNYNVGKSKSNNN